MSRAASKIAVADGLASRARRDQRRLVHEVREVRAREAGGAARDRSELDVGLERHLARVHAEDLLAALDVGVAHHHLAIEASGTQERRIEDVVPVRRGDDDDALGLGEAVHLDQQLVQRLLALLVAQRVAAAIAADRVELVDEDDARLVAARLLEQLAHARRADARVHLDEVGSADGDEGHARFAGHRPRQQRLARSRRSHQEDAARNAAADRFEALRLLEELDDFADLVLRLVDAGHIGKRHVDELRIDGARPLERRHAARDRSEEREAGDAEQQQAERHRAVTGGVRVLAGLDVEANPALGQVGDKRLVARDVSLGCDCLDTRAVDPVELEHVLRLRDVTHAAGLNVVEEIGERRAGPRGLAGRPQQVEGPDG